MGKHLTFLFTLIILLIIPLNIDAQVQIGSDIDGLAANDKFGNGVSMSSDGNIVAICSDGNLGSGGLLRVFKNIGGVWTLYGTDINGENFGGASGYKISLSSDGNTLAYYFSVGLTIYSYDTATGYWTQKGNYITTNTPGDGFGSSYELSSDGNTIIIGASGAWHPPEPAAGYVQIFHYDAGTWNQIGNNITGIAPERSGREVTMSSDANIVAIANTNSVRVYENISDVWTQLGNEISAYETSGLSLSSDGNLLAIGESEFTDSLIQRGRVRVFNYASDAWSQIGFEIVGEVAHYRTGWSVSLSSDGDTLAIGEIGSSSGSTDSGRTRVFNNQGGNWVQIGTSIFGEGSGDSSGSEVSLSSDGNTIAIGAPGNDGNGINAGHVRVHNLSALLSAERFKLDDFRIYPNPAKNVINIELMQGVNLKKVNLYNTLGQFIFTTQYLKISTSNFNSGIYFIEVETNKGNSVKRIIVE